MYMYGNFENPTINKISLSSIKYLAKELDDFLKAYEKKILITDPTIKHNVECLKHISEILNNERYDLIINQPGLVIDFSNDNEDYLPEYYPI